MGADDSIQASSASEILNSVRVDRSVVSVKEFGEPDNDLAYWLTKTPQERLEAAELLRIIAYGYDPATDRLQRVLAITEFPPS